MYSSQSGPYVQRVSGVLRSGGVVNPRSPDGERTLLAKIGCTGCGGWRSCRLLIDPVPIGIRLSTRNHA